MSDINSSISGTQSGGFATKDKVMNQTIGRQSSIKSGASKKKSDSGLAGISDYYNPVAEKVQKTGDFISDFFTGFSAGLAFENGVPDSAYEI
ncbi:MAG: hypothetical protein ACRBB3_04175 [Alphaproteobacteria bacterium]